MPRQVDMRREHLLRERAFREREQSFEAHVHWFVYDMQGSTRHPIYDESGERRYKKRANVPILWWYDEEGGDRMTGEGRTLWRVMNLATTVAALRNTGIDPESDDRVSDLILFRGWYWDIIDFTLTSQTSEVNPHTEGHGDDSTVRIRAYRRYPESDMPGDYFPEPPPAPEDPEDPVDPPTYPVYEP